MNTSVRLRPMSEQDLDVVAGIEAATFTTPWSRTAFQRVIRDPGNVRAWVASRAEANVAVGYAVYWFTEDEGELANIAVEPASKGTGIGKALLEHVLAAARADGVAHLFLEVRASNRVAIALYTHYGFEQVGQRKGYYTLPREDALVLRLQLEA